MSATIRKIVTENIIYGHVEKTAYYIKEYHTVDITYLYVRHNVDEDNSAIEYVIGIDDDHIKKFLSLFGISNAEYNKEEIENNYEPLEQWEYYAIRRANMAKPLTKENVLEYMKEKNVKIWE